MKQIEEPLPKDIADLLDSPEFDDEAGLLIESVEFSDADLRLTFSVRFFNDEIPKQLWQVTVTDVKEEYIKRGWTQNLAIYKKHILLLEYHDLNPELYFKGSTKNDERLFIDIYNSIRQLADNFNHISKYILPPERIKTLSNQNYGLFARGPKTILDIYANELIKQGIKPIFIGDGGLFNKDIHLKLLEFGESYFIGSDFIFERKL